MIALAYRLARLERVRPPAQCTRCLGVFYGVAFERPAPGDYDPGPPGSRPPPHPPQCPACGREMAKQWLLPDRACWDGI